MTRPRPRARTRGSVSPRGENAIGGARHGPGPFRDRDGVQLERLRAVRDRLRALAEDASTDPSALDRLRALQMEERALIRAIDARAHEAAPLLDSLRVASPCHEPWSAMSGDDRSRHCARCEKDVHDLSALTRTEAEAFLREHSGACVRFYRRIDGTILTADCPVGMRTRRVRRLALAVIGGGLAGGGVALQAALAGGLPAQWREDTVHDHEPPRRPAPPIRDDAKPEPTEPVEDPLRAPVPSDRFLVATQGYAAPIEPDPFHGLLSKPAALGLVSSLPSKVYVDGRHVGTSPLFSINVTPGTHVVEFRHPKLGRRSQVVTVKADEIRAVSVDF
jgi:hypothetical protein